MFQPCDIENAPLVKSYEVKEFIARHNISDRESDVFLLLANGMTTTNEISQQLGLSPNTISNHLNSLLNKTQAKNKSELLSKLLRLHAFKLDELKLLSRRPRVLLVDSDPDTCITVQQNLALRGFHVFTMQHPQKTPQVLCGMHLDMILVAQEQNGLNGLEVINQIRAGHENCPPFALYTSQEISAIRVPAGVEVLRKPINYNNLAFHVLDAFIESPKIKSRFQRVNPSDLAAEINEAQTYEILNIGFGGVSISIPRTLLLKDKSLRKAKRLNFKIKLTPEKQISGEAEVCWIRKKDQFGLKSGLGLKFTMLPQADVFALKEYVRSNKYVSLSSL